MKSLEICAGTGYECNVANLVINHLCSGPLIDGSPANIQRAKKFYQRRKESMYWPPNILQAWITRNNIKQLLSDAGYVDEIHLLSLDIDGVGYWLWESITVISPREVVLEFNHLHGPMASVTVPYRDVSVVEFTEHGSDYAGASLAAFIKFAKRMGYRYVGSNAISTSAYYARDDIPATLLSEGVPGDAFVHPRAQFGTLVRYPKIKHMEWVEV